MTTRETNIYPIFYSDNNEYIVEKLKYIIDTTDTYSKSLSNLKNIYETKKVIKLNKNFIYFKDVNKLIATESHSIENEDDLGILFSNLASSNDKKTQLLDYDFIRKYKDELIDLFPAKALILCKNILEEIYLYDLNKIKLFGYEKIYDRSYFFSTILKDYIFEDETILAISMNYFSNDELKIENFADFFYNIGLKYDLIPNEFFDTKKRNKFLPILNKYGNYIHLTDDLEIKMDLEKIKKAISDELENGDYIIQNKDIKEEKLKEIKNDLLNCDKTRCAIDSYEEKILTDPNRGHWELWVEEGQKYFTLEMDTTYIARNPKCDINSEGIIAIDFGTKSTVVVYQKDIEHTLPMAIGDGEIKKNNIDKRYENPTVMEFVNLNDFLSAYDSRLGRPKTRWGDLLISHAAIDKFNACNSDEYYAFFSEIKQWAGQRQKQIRIKPIEGQSFILPPFMDLKEDDFNPIEIYAYYIGLYINNMRNGIFLDYYLSFPVTYEKNIRNKIMASFEKGLKKSLPDCVLNDSEIMSQFKINGSISEPSAYAVCALEEYGFDPSGDEKYFYGIFDFGGGTTDFDFGIWSESKKRRYDYCIESVASGGDEYLGGENILAMLAFEIFKQEQDFMRENNYCFTLAPKSKDFIGSDSVISTSQEAEKNMHNLIKVLRPYWEDSSNYEKIYGYNNYIKEKLNLISQELEKNEGKNNLNKEKIKQVLSKIENDFEKNSLKKNINYVDDKKLNEIIEKILFDDNTKGYLEQISVNLYDKNGESKVAENFNINLKFIYEFIEDKIREGVKSFFSSLLMSYQKEIDPKIDKVNILLAGNSCKSPLVSKVFNEEIEKVENEIKEKYKLQDEISHFEIFPPLGTKEADEKLKSLQIKFDKNNLERPTCKTGVAYGLIKCKKGGKIEIKDRKQDEEVPFKYFIGWQSKKKFEIFRDSENSLKILGKPDYDVWHKFIEADEDTFYIYYTSLPECVEDNFLVEGNSAVKRLKCMIDNVDEDSFVYVKALTPHSLQYIVSKSDNIEEGKIGEVYTRELD